MMTIMMSIPNPLTAPCRPNGEGLNPRPAHARLAHGAWWPAAVLAAALLLIARPASSAATANAALAAPGDPTAMVKAVIDQATAIVRDTRAPVAERDRKLRAVAEGSFDFGEMARTSLGYHWRALTQEQRAQFVPLFTSFMENVYLSKMKDYSVEKVRRDIATSNVSFTGQQFVSPNYAEVHSRVVLTDHPQPVRVDYLLRRNGASWKIYDLEIDAISVMANYRNQFNRVINDNGYPALVSLLQKKTQQLGATINK